MGDGDLSSRLGNTKALLGILAGAGASYGIYKLVSGGSLKKSQKSVTSEGPGGRQAQPGALLAKVSGLDVVCPAPEAASGNHTPRKEPDKHAASIILETFVQLL